MVTVRIRLGGRPPSGIHISVALSKRGTNRHPVRLRFPAGVSDAGGHRTRVGVSGDCVESNSLPRMSRLLVMYDIDTRSPTALRRRRAMATICCRHGERLQQSVFECYVPSALRERFVARLTRLTEDGKDRLRVYQLPPG